MAKPPARRLKVFQAQFGFYDTVVAAASQAAALQAWGTHQNLFASGQARAMDDPQAIEAALANPGMTLKRAAGSDEPFALEATSLPSVPDAPKRAADRPPATPPPPAKPPVDRSSLDAAEAALRKLDEDRKREEAEIRQRQDALDAKRSEAQAAYVEARKAATTAVVAARGAYRDAGGED
jgi:hypothetical protein